MSSDTKETMHVTVGSVTVELIEHGDRVCAHMRDGGSFEPETLALWGRLCASAIGRTVVDVGCYTGLFAIAAAKIGARVQAFEPFPANRKRIVNNAHRNGVRDRITLHTVALSDRRGSTVLHFNPAVTGLTSGASIVNANLGNVPSAPMDVETKPLDALMLRDVVAMKVDVERAEPLVLRGAVQTIRRCRPAIIAEVLGRAERAAVAAALPDYRVAKELDGRNVLLMPA